MEGFAVIPYAEPYRIDFGIVEPIPQPLNILTRRRCQSHLWEHIAPPILMSENEIPSGAAETIHDYHLHR